MGRTKWNVGDVLRLCEQHIRLNQQLPTHVKRSAYDIIRCRTAFMGGHKMVCNKCGHQRIAYNSCRNRHCPTCQYSKREQWILDREADLLPVRYFHLVFTMPCELNQMAKAYPRQLYNILFKAAWHTVRSLSVDRKWLGGKTGMIALLHTWGQNLSLHPHLHCIIPGGAFIPEVNRWIKPKKKSFLFPVRVMSTMYRGKFMDYLETEVNKQIIGWSNAQWQELKSTIRNKGFNVYCKKAFGGPQQVIKYLGRYSHRVAITNHRILNITQTTVKFQYMDYRDGSKKVLELSHQQFTHRFLLHVLPKGFNKIRHYGILSNKSKNLLIPVILRYFERRRTKPRRFDPVQHLQNHLQIDIRRCNKCQQGLMQCTEIILAIRGSPKLI